MKTPSSTATVASGETPRTDELVTLWDDDGASRGSAYMELRDLARQLERELAEAKLGEALHQNAAGQLAQMAVDSLPSSKKRTIEEFKEIVGDDGTPLERLRFFCSFGLNGDDWLDVEPFFDAVEKELKQARSATERPSGEAADKARYILRLLDSRQISDGSPGVICAREILRLVEQSSSSTGAK